MDLLCPYKAVASKQCRLFAYRRWSLCLPVYVIVMLRECVSDFVAVGC